MKPGIQLRLHQQLALTPQLQQAIRLLQLSQVELETELRELAETNPLLELDPPEEAGEGAEGEAETAPAEAEPEASAEYESEPWEERELGGEAPLPSFSDDDDSPEHQDAAQE
ncbi:MAG TPA: RNA polymerase factor sigma-54, partial [Rhodanobacteraceae bacterium]